MPLKARRMVGSDIEECLELAATRPFFREQYGALSVPRAAEVCKHLLGKASVNGAVVEDLARPAGKRILTSGFAAFINPEWLRGYMADPFPFPGSLILRRIADGVDDIVLSQDELRHANCSGEGLRALVLMMSWNPDLLERTDLFELKTTAIESFLLGHRGFRLAELVHEVFPGFEQTLCLSGRAWIERSRYPKHYPGTNGETSGPVLIGLTRAEAQGDDNVTGRLTPLFVWQEFLLCFTPTQQKILELVCEHRSDAAIAAELGIGQDAVGRRMQRIYRRVVTYQDPHDAAFLPGVPSADRRKLLIDYLRSHPHELRPHAARTRSQKAMRAAGMEQS